MNTPHLTEQPGAAKQAADILAKFPRGEKLVKNFRSGQPLFPQYAVEDRAKSDQEREFLKRLRQCLEKEQKYIDTAAMALDIEASSPGFDTNRYFNAYKCVISAAHNEEETGVPSAAALNIGPI